MSRTRRFCCFLPHTQLVSLNVPEARGCLHGVLWLTFYILHCITPVMTQEDPSPGVTSIVYRAFVTSGEVYTLLDQQTFTIINYYVIIFLYFLHGQMNRITALISTCEDRLKQVRRMMDELDTHVAGKTLLAYFMTYVCIIGSISKYLAYFSTLD